MSFSEKLYILLSTGSTLIDRKLSKHDWKILDRDAKQQHKPLKVNHHCSKIKFTIFFMFLGVKCFGLILYVPVNSSGYVGMVSSPNHLHILLLVTDNNPS